MLTPRRLIRLQFTADIARARNAFTCAVAHASPDHAIVGCNCLFCEILPPCIRRDNPVGSWSIASDGQSQYGPCNFGRSDGKDDGRYNWLTGNLSLMDPASMLLGFPASRFFQGFLRSR